MLKLKINVLETGKETTKDCTQWKKDGQIVHGKALQWISSVWLRTKVRRLIWFSLRNFINHLPGNFIIYYQPLNLLHLDDGRWTEWSQWTDCSKTCESGVRNRTKSCIYKDFAAKGKDCPETKTFQQEICNVNECIATTPGIIV